MADETYTLSLTGNEIDTLLGILKNSQVTQTQLEYLDGLTSNIQNQIDTHTQSADKITAGTFAGKVVGNGTAEATLTDGQFRNIFISANEPTSNDGSDGDVWIIYNL